MIPDFATNMLFLNNMRSNNFRWAKCNKILWRQKNELCANLLAQPFILQKEATVTSDDSEKVIGGVFSQERHLFIYVSRKLTPAEQNFSNIERDVLAIVFVVSRLKQFLLRTQFTLQTDHKPLNYHFASDEEIPKTASARITRWAVALIGFDIELEYTPGEVTQAEIKTELVTNRPFQDIMKRSKSGNWKKCSEAEKEFE